MERMRVIVFVIFMAMALSGLSGCGGGGAEIKHQSYPVTLGQELEDLEKAHQQGLLNDKEYKKIRKEIIKRYTD